MLELIQRLRERRVFRGASYYIVGSWLLLQVGSTVFEPMGLPDWSMTLLLYILMSGFPLAVLMSWRFDFTLDHGLVRAHDHLDSDVDPSLLKVRPADYLLVFLLLAITALVVWRALPAAQQTSSTSVSTPVAPVFTAEPGSIAVLPFASLSQSENTGFMADGISDTVTHVLSQVDGIKVIARTSAFFYKGKNLPVQEIATALEVAHVLEGSVQQAANNMRIIARLIHAPTGAEVWSGYYDREPGAIFEIQDEIAQEVATALKVNVLGGDDVDLVASYQPDLRAFEKFILGRAELDKGTSAGNAAAYVLFEEAIEIDPQYAHAYIMLGTAILRQGSINNGLSRSETIKRLEKLVATALDLDPLLPEAHIAQARQFTAIKQVEAAERSARRALELSPSHPEAYSVLSSVASMRNNQDEALDYAREAASLDPEDTSLQISLALRLWAVGRSEAAIATIKRVIEREPNKPSHYGLLARYLRQMGRSGEAMYWDDRAVALDPDNPNMLFVTCLGLLQLWDFDGSLQCVRDFLEQSPDAVEATQYLAVLTQDVDLAIRNLEPEVEANPSFQYRKMQLAEWLLLANRYEFLVEMARDSFPGLFEDVPVVTDRNIWMARSLVAAHIGLGDIERANLIIDKGLEHLSMQRKLQGGGIASGTDDVMFLALRGDYAEAIERLAEAIDRDWQFYSFGMKQPQGWPAEFFNDPRFKAQVARQEEKMAAQRAWYAENRERDLLNGY